MKRRSTLIDRARLSRLVFPVPAKSRPGATPAPVAFQRRRIRVKFVTRLGVSSSLAPNVRPRRPAFLCSGSARLVGGPFQASFTPCFRCRGAGREYRAGSRAWAALFFGRRAPEMTTKISSALSQRERASTQRGICAKPKNPVVPNTSAIAGTKHCTRSSKHARQRQRSITTRRHTQLRAVRTARRVPH